MQTDDLYHTTNKGMTIFKAFLLVFLCVGLIHVTGFFFQAGFFYGFFNASVNNTTTIGMKPNLYGQLIAYIIFILIGFKVNNYEKPYFHTVKFFDYIKMLVLGFLWILFCILLNDLVTAKNIGTVTVNQDFKEYLHFKGSLRNLNSFLYNLFYIGVLGHGLLKKYHFNKIIIVLAFFSLPMLHPTVVLQYFFLNLILIFIYYHTQALQLTLVFMLMAGILDHFFALLYSPQELRYGNIIKDHIIGNEIAYYIFMVFVLVLFMYILLSFKSPEKRKFWLKNSE